MSSHTREENAILFVLGGLMELKEKGLVEGGNVVLSEEGLEQFKLLKKTNFHPTQDEIESAMKAIQSA